MNQENQNNNSFWQQFRSLLNSTWLFSSIKTRTRGEWVNSFSDILSGIYQALTANSEKSLLIGFLAGILSVLLLKQIFFLILLLLVICALIYLIADEQRVVSDSSENIQNSGE